MGNFSLSVIALKIATRISLVGMEWDIAEENATCFPTLVCVCECDSHLTLTIVENFLLNCFFFKSNFIFFSNYSSFYSHSAVCDSSAVSA